MKPDTTSYELTYKQARIIGNALSVYKEELELKLTEWEIKEEGKQLIREILRELPPLENKFKDF